MILTKTRKKINIILTNKKIKNTVSCFINIIFNNNNIQSVQIKQINKYLWNKNIKCDLQPLKFPFKNLKFLKQKYFEDFLKQNKTKNILFFIKIKNITFKNEQILNSYKRTWSTIKKQFIIKISINSYIKFIKLLKAKAKTFFK